MGAGKIRHRNSRSDLDYIVITARGKLEIRNLRHNRESGETASSTEVVASSLVDHGRPNTRQKNTWDQTPSGL